jgi:hypothetical protein
MSSFELEYTGDPGFQSEWPADGLVFVVQQAPVAHPGAAGRRLDDISEGIYSIL